MERQFFLGVVWVFFLLLLLSIVFQNLEGELILRRWIRRLFGPAIREKRGIWDAEEYFSFSYAQYCRKCNNHIAMLLTVPQNPVLDEYGVQDIWNDL